MCNSTSLFTCIGPLPLSNRADPHAIYESSIVHRVPTWHLLLEILLYYYSVPTGVAVLGSCWKNKPKFLSHKLVVS